MKNEELFLNDWKCTIANVVGLRYVPTIEPEYSDSEQRMFTRVKDGFDLPLCIHSNLPSHEPLIHKGHSVRKSHTDTISGAVTSSTKTVLEIGINVYKRPLLSTTRAVLDNKENDCIYLGIDVNDKSTIDDDNKNIHTMMINSNRRADIRSQMLKLGINTIDLLIIDGDHSIDSTINDWCFVEFLSPFGIVIIHDTNVHIGPRAVFDAIDKTSFDKKLIGTEMKEGKFPDYGMGIARRLF